VSWPRVRILEAWEGIWGLFLLCLTNSLADSTASCTTVITCMFLSWKISKFLALHMWYIIAIMCSILSLCVFVIVSYNQSWKELSWFILSQLRVIGEPNQTALAQSQRKNTWSIVSKALLHLGQIGLHLIPFVVSLSLTWELSQILASWLCFRSIRRLWSS
jgi:hypothetical protein